MLKSIIENIDIRDVLMNPKVKFLIDTYGREKFLDTYKTLVNGQNSKQNIEKLEGIYNKSFSELEKKWMELILEK